MKKISSTLGFLFSSDLSKVLLIEKQKPIHHKGLLNGLGGKLELNEDELECIVREVDEESGLKTIIDSWQKVGELNWTEWEVGIFTSVYLGNLNDLDLKEDLVVDWYDVSHLPSNCVTNLYWLIPYCLDVLKTRQHIQINILYH